MSALPYIPLFVADYLADTSHLSTLEHGAYLLLIMNYWQRGEALPSGDGALARIARVSEKEWAKIKTSIAPFFDDVEGAWVHGRIESELAKVRSKSETRARAGRASAEAKAQRKPSKSSTYVEHKPNYTETDTETEEDWVGSAGARTVSRETEIPSTDQWADLEKRLRDAAGWQSEPHPNLAIVGPVIAAVGEGVDVELDLLPAARAHGPALRSRTSWNYILQAAITARNNRIAMAADAAKPIMNSPAGDFRHDHRPARSNLAIITGNG